MIEGQPEERVPESPPEGPEGPAAGSQEATAGSPGASKKKAKADEDPDAELEFADLPVPSADELRAALDWAFENEDAPAALLDAFARHAEMVLRGNQRMNLTKIVEAREVAAKHYLDSWRATRLIPLLGRRVLDVGTGAGFPGIPVALAEDQTRVDLIDSTRKRADFVRECIDALALGNTGSVWERAEEHLVRNAYDIVMMRAVSSVRENVRLFRRVRHQLKDLVMLKGASWSREVRAAEREAERLGFRLDTVWEHELPEGMGARAILVYRAPGSQ